MKIQALWGEVLRPLLNTKQLPPINPEDDNHILDNPHVFLDEIMRQAQESEIIRLSMHVREGKPLSSFEAAGAQVKIYTPQQLVDGMYEWADQILCATNATRIAINNTVRKMRNYSEEPQLGDKVISLRNHWDDFSNSGNWALTNGVIGTIENYNVKLINVPRYISTTPIAYMNTHISLDDGDCFSSIPIDYTALKTGSTLLTPRQQYLLNKHQTAPDAPYEFAYAYAITTHKAQGSEWDKVMVIEERFPYPVDEHRRWLYTACTRAKEKLVVIQH